jgi:hypothetical protein
MGKKSKERANKPLAFWIAVARRQPRHRFHPHDDEFSYESICPHKAAWRSASRRSPKHVRAFQRQTIIGQVKDLSSHPVAALMGYSNSIASCDDCPSGLFCDNRNQSIPNLLP